MSRVAVFVFPNAVGHLSPALPLARQLALRGWRPHVVSFEAFRVAVEAAKATFWDAEKLLEPWKLGRSWKVKYVGEYW
jgi:UDP:flavonoid glycosyltransferase YjiC (YdhE family)